MNLIEVNIPPFSESVSEGTIAGVYKSVGDYVNRDDNLADIETDKVMLTLPCPISGVIVDVLIRVGDVVNANQVAFRIDSSAEQPLSSSPRISAMPSAAKLLAEKGMDASTIQGSGKEGRILKQDVMSAPSVEPSGRVEEVVPMTRLRQRVAERLLDSQRNNAILTTFNEVNMKAVIDLRSKYKTIFEKEHEIKLGFMGFFVKAAVYALKRYPIMNASVDGNNIIYHGYFDIGVAIGSPRGLVVPIIRDADKLSLADIEKKIAEFSTKAREGKLTMEELSGGTYTISNGGTFGSMMSTPIINPPQSAILGMHATKERPIVENSQIVIRPMMYLAQSYDHRIIDGKEAVLSLVAIKEAIEDPAKMILEI